MSPSKQSSLRVLARIGVLVALGPSACGDPGGYGSWSCDGALGFADARLEQAIRDAVGKPAGDLLAADVADLTYLEGSSLQIGDLGGIQCLAALTELYLGDNQISDIGPLERLTSLEELVLEVNGIADIGPLEGVTNLTTLSLHSNQVGDLGPLVRNAGLGDGDVVWLAENPIDLDAQAANIQALEDRGVTLVF
jgi:Leucine-rich repeat (LRR) protein